MILGPFTGGPMLLTVSWADGTQTFTYTVLTPCAPPLVHTDIQQPEDMLQCNE